MMKGTQVGRTVILVVAVLGSTGISSGETFEVALPDLVGAYGSTKTCSFDFGTSFESIQKARIRWAGTLTPGLGRGDGVELPADVWFDWPTQIAAYMEADSGGWHASSGPFDGVFSTEEQFEGSLSATWDFLLDGQGEVSVSLSPLIVIGGVMVMPPSGSISEAYLEIDAIVPEPATLSLLALGVLSLLPRRRRCM